MDHGESGWVQPHLSFASSDRESELRRDAERNRNVPKCGPTLALADMKATITTMFSQFLGLDQHFKLFGLFARTPSDLSTLVFVHKMRMDLSSFTVVLDAFVLERSSDLLPKIDMTLQSSISRIQCSSEEFNLWRMLLPALAERARHKWHHRSECEYIWNGNVLTMRGVEQDRLCGCGKGKNVDGFREVKGWSHLATSVTRVAISPLFAVSYLEEIGGDFANLLGEVNRGTNQAAQTWRQLRATLKQRPTLNSDMKELRKSILRRSGGQPLRQIDTDVCIVCGSSGQPKLMQCSRCKKVKYCSIECQRGDWKAHKPRCNT